MTTADESTIQLSKYARDNDFIAAGLSAWVHRLDAVIKSYPLKRSRERDTEISVYRRLGSEKSWHKGILRFYGILDSISLVLQYASHGSVRQYLGRPNGQTVSLSTQLRWAEQATEAIAFLHSKKIFHCDISCNNIFLDKDLNAMIGDFGGSSIDGKEFLSWYETSHCPPDLIQPSTKTEIFALGSTLYEIVRQEKPFHGLEEHEIENAIRSARFPCLKSLPLLGVPIHKCWHQEYETVDELLHDIKSEAAVVSALPVAADWSCSHLLICGIAAFLPFVFWMRSGGSLLKR
jgi:serine/threonine protein kinase